MKTFNQFFIEAESGIVVYHGSNADGIGALNAHMPKYDGGLGKGVYVATFQQTAEYYGQHVYELRTKFNWNEILIVGGEENYMPIPGMQDSILVGEIIYPFSFYIRKNKYSVVDGSGFPDEECWVAKATRFYNLVSLLGVEVGYQDVEDVGSSPEWINLIKDELHAMYNKGDFPYDADDFEAVENHPQIRQELQNIIDQSSDVSFLGELISLDSIGAEVEAAGYKAVFADGIRNNAPVNEEILVFDENDLVKVRQIK